MAEQNERKMLSAPPTVTRVHAEFLRREDTGFDHDTVMLCQTAGGALHSVGLQVAADSMGKQVRKGDRR